MTTGLQKAIERHEKWWLGKYIRRADCGAELNLPFKKVVKIETVGSLSYVYGSAEFTFEDGTRHFAIYTDAYRPRKKDWEVRDDDAGLSDEYVQQVVADAEVKRRMDARKTETN